MLNVVEFPKPEPAEDVLSLLRHFLKNAKAGKYASVGIATVKHDGSVTTSWDNGANRVALLGAVAVLQHRLAADIDED